MLGQVAPASPFVTAVATLLDHVSPVGVTASR
jgi:hypothetical protein